MNVEYLAYADHLVYFDCDVNYRVFCYVSAFATDWKLSGGFLSFRTYFCTHSSIASKNVTPKLQLVEKRYVARVDERNCTASA